MVQAALLAHDEIEDWDYDLETSAGDETGKQKNEAFFVHGDVSLPTATRITAGWRKERVRKQGDTGWLVYDRKDTLHAGEFGVNQTVLPGWNVYGRLASSYRLPNVDENRATSGAAALLPQRNSDREVGVKWALGAYSGTVRHFTQKVDHEIAYDNLQYANVNLDPTRRRGVEIEGRKLTEDELVGFAFNLFIGGLDTVTSLLGNIFCYLGRYPERQRELREKPGLIVTAVEEFLRAYAPREAGNAG